MERLSPTEYLEFLSSGWSETTFFEFRDDGDLVELYRHGRAEAQLDYHRDKGGKEEKKGDYFRVLVLVLTAGRPSESSRTVSRFSGAEPRDFVAG